MEARSLTQLTTVPVTQRVALIAEGLDLIAEQVTTLHGDLRHLIEVGRRRSAAVVDGLAQEEAAKPLILLDVVRMGWRDQALVQRQLRRFYDHLARGIYARVVDVRPADLAEVRRLWTTSWPRMSGSGRRPDAVMTTPRCGRPWSSS